MHNMGDDDAAPAPAAAVPSTLVPYQEYKVQAAAQYTAISDTLTRTLSRFNEGLDRLDVLRSRIPAREEAMLREVTALESNINTAAYNMTVAVVKGFTALQAITSHLMDVYDAKLDELTVDDIEKIDEACAKLFSCQQQLEAVEAAIGARNITELVPKLYELGGNKELLDTSAELDARRLELEAYIAEKHTFVANHLERCGNRETLQLLNRSLAAKKAILSNKALTLEQKKLKLEAQAQQARADVVANRTLVNSSRRSFLGFTISSNSQTTYRGEREYRELEGKVNDLVAQTSAALNSNQQQVDSIDQHVAANQMEIETLTAAITASTAQFKLIEGRVRQLQAQVKLARDKIVTFEREHGTSIRSYDALVVAFVESKRLLENLRMGAGMGLSTYAGQLQMLGNRVQLSKRAWRMVLPEVLVPISTILLRTMENMQHMQIEQPARVGLLQEEKE